MKLQSASRKEVRRIAIGSGICAAGSVLFFLLLDQFRILTFSYRIIVGLAIGTVVAIINFALMCLMIQNAAGTTDQKQLKAKVQLSYNLRLAIQAGWVIIAFITPWISVLGAALPLLFPTAVIYYLRATGKLMPADPAPASNTEQPEDLPDMPGTFEV